MNRIIYLQDNGVIAVIVPTDEALEKYGIHVIAEKDVPEGKPYKIVDQGDIPSDRSMRAAWTVDLVDLNDGVGAAHTTFQGVMND